MATDIYFCHLSQEHPSAGKQYLSWNLNFHSKNVSNFVIEEELLEFQLHYY